MLAEFKKFLFRGNVLDLAVAVVIGAAFVAIVNSLVADLLTPLIAAVFGKPDFSALAFTINDSTFRYGAFLNAAFSFITIAAAVFFLVIVPVNALISRMRKEAPLEPATRRCPECLSEVPLEARRCAFCTSSLIGVESSN